MAVQPQQTVQRVQRQVAEDFLRRCARADVRDSSFTYDLHHDSVSIPAVVLKFVVLSVMFKLDHPRKWRAAFEHGWIPEPLLAWLGVGSLQEMIEQVQMSWVYFQANARFFRGSFDGLQ